MGISKKLGSIGVATACVLALGTGAAQAKVVKGDGGDNNLKGTSQDDKMSGRGGDDRMNGGKGVDVVRGNAGNDTLSGGQDNEFDQLIGNGGKDLFYSSGPDQVDGGPGRDVVYAAGVTKDSFIDCGGGRDKVFYYEEGNVPATLNCEVVKYEEPLGL